MKNLKISEIVDKKVAIHTKNIIEMKSLLKNIQEATNEPITFGEKEKEEIYNDFKENTTFAFKTKDNKTALYYCDERTFVDEEYEINEYKDCIVE